MRSIDGQSLAQMLGQFKNTQKWKELDIAVNECYQSTYKNPKLLEVYGALMDDKAWKRQIGVLEFCNQPYVPGKQDDYQDEMKKKAGIFNAYLLQSYAKNKSSKQAIKYYFSILFNFRISYQIKKLFIKSISSFRIVWRQQLGMLLQNALLVLMDTVEKLEVENKEGIYYEALSVDDLETIYTIQISWPKQSNEVYESIMILTNLLFQHLNDEEQSYVTELAKILRKTTQLILKDQFFVEKTQLIKDLLDQWIQLVVQEYEFCEDDYREKQKKLQKVIQLVASWEDIYQGMIKILQIYSPSTYHQELDQEIYNYLKLQQNFENENYYILKQKAAQVLKILIENNQQKEGYERLGTKYSKRVIWSIIQSLQLIVGSQHLLDLQQQKTCVLLLELFAEILFTGVEISGEQIKYLLEHILIQLFESQLDDIWALYEKDTQDFSKRIEDCCQLQLLPSMASKLAKAIQYLGEYNDQSCKIVNDFVIKSLIANKNSIMQVVSQSQFPDRKIKNTTCFLLLSILCSNSQQLHENVEYLKQIFVIEYIAVLSEIQVALIYDFFCYIELDFFVDQDILGQLIDSTLVEDMSPALRKFAISLLQNINLDYFTQNQLLQFINLYELLEKKSSLHLVLQNLITKKVLLFTPECFVKIIDSSIRNLDREIIAINYAVQNQLKYSAQEAYRYIKLCEILAKQQYIVCSEQMVQKLWRIVENIQKVRYISFDDELIKIGSCLLDNTKRLPRDLLVLEKVIQSFKYNGYDGCFYFQFFFKVYQNCNQETLQLAYTIQDLIMEVASIFLFHPNYSELTQENWVSLNNSLWIAHSILEQKLSLQIAFWKDIQDNLQKFPLLMSQISLSPALIIRFINLKLAFTHKLRLTGQSKQNYDPEMFNYELISDLANLKKIYGYEAKLLVSNLTNLLPDIKCKGHPTIWIVFIYLLRADHQRRSNYQNRKKQEDQDRNFNKILSLIIPSFQLERTLSQQILLFIETFKSKDMINYLDSLNKLTSQNQAELSQWLKTEVSQRVIFKVTEIKTNENQQISSRNNGQTQNTKSIMRNVDNGDSQLGSLRKRMKNFMIFQKEQTQDQSGDQEERKIFSRGQKPLKKLCIDREDIKKMEGLLQKKLEFTQSKRDVLRQKSLRKKKMREQHLD